MRTPKLSMLLTAALGMAFVAGGCSSAPKDQDLATTIKGQMFSSPALRSADLDVSVKSGEATITGDVPDDTTRLQAYKLAADTPGVKHVVDNMTVASAQAATPLPPAAEAAPAVPAAHPKVAKSAQPAEKKERRHSIAESHLVSTQPAPTEVAQAAPEPPPLQPDPTPPPQPEAAPAPAPAPPTPPPPPPQPTHVEIPSGTPVRIQMIDSVDSAKGHVGDMFHASLDSPLVVNNQIVVPAGVDMYVKLVTVQSAGHLSGQSELALELVRMEYQGKEYSLQSNQYKKSGTSRGTQTGERVGGGAVVGALLGAVLGGGKGAVIGGATGAGAGTAVQGATNGQQIQVKSEAKLDFSLQQPVELSYFPDKNPPANRQ
jgi:hypothetical protein